MFCGFHPRASTWLLKAKFGLDALPSPLVATPFETQFSEKAPS
jgi:hypothetical protein